MSEAAAALADPVPAEEGGRVVAFFDMDLTLLTVNSARLWVQFERREGRIDRKQFLTALGWMIQYRLGLLDMGSVTERAMSLAAGQGVHALSERTWRWYESMVRPHISSVGRARVQAHREVGHTLAVLTASTEFAAVPLARDLGIHHVVSTILEVRDGHLTGAVEQPVCYGEGKLTRGQRFLEQLGADISDAWFYSDSISDLPVLQAVGHPVAVNPDPRLLRHARKVGWPVVRFD